jgi:hypothetical protein
MLPLLLLHQEQKQGLPAASRGVLLVHRTKLLLLRTLLKQLWQLVTAAATTAAAAAALLLSFGKPACVWAQSNPA